MAEPSERIHGKCRAIPFTTVDGLVVYLNTALIESFFIMASDVDEDEPITKAIVTMMSGKTWQLRDSDSDVSVAS